jgi:hypothetical protein
LVALQRRLGMVGISMKNHGSQAVPKGCGSQLLPLLPTVSLSRVSNSAQTLSKLECLVDIELWPNQAPRIHAASQFVVVPLTWTIIEQIHVNREKEAAAGLTVSGLSPTPSSPSEKPRRKLGVVFQYQCPEVGFFFFCFSCLERRAVLIDGQRRAQQGTTLAPLLQGSSQATRQPHHTSDQ